MAVRTETQGEQGKQAALHITLLGGFRVAREGEALPDAAWRRPQARTLIKLLAVEPSHRLHREQLIELFWPEQSIETAAANLRRLLYLVRRSLPAEAAGVIEQRDEVVALDPEQVWIDADVFEQAARGALAGGSETALAAALALYAGELLPEERYAAWAEQRREELTGLQRQLLLTLARLLAERGEAEGAIERLRWAVALDPAHEPAYRELMRLHAARGNRAEALRQYERCREALAEQVGVEPDAETEALHRQIEAGVGGPPALILPPAVTRPWRTPLIGRERALDLVLIPPIPPAAGRARPASERTGVVLVRGEAGVGKTRLAAEAAREAARRGCLVLWGSCSVQAAYGPFVEALEQYLSGLQPNERAALAREHPEMSRILPSLDPALAPSPAESAGDELRLFAALARMLAQLASFRPVLLVLDDLQQGDDATLALVEYLARLPVERRNWLVLATYRIEDALVGGTLAVTLGDLQRGVRCRQVDLLRLGRRECDRLVATVLGGTVEEAAADHIFSTSQGNPLFAVELLGALRTAGELCRTDAGWQLRGGANASQGIPISAQVADLIASRIAALDEDTRKLLSFAAVAGMSVPAAVLQRGLEITGRSVEGFLDSLERAVEARVLLEEAGPEPAFGDYSFQHPLFREVVYAQLGAARRVHLHGVVARAMEAVQPTDVEALAYQYSRSGDRGKRIEYVEKAGDRARSIYANARAESYYRELLGLLSAPEDADHGARVRLKLGAALNLLGRYDEALAVLEEAAAGFAAAGDPDEHGRAVAAIATAHVMRGTGRDVVELLEGTIEELDDRADALLLAELFDALARCLLALGRYQELTRASERGLAYARQHAGDPQARWHLGRAEFQRAMAAAVTRPPAEKERVLAEAMPAIERAGDPYLLMQALNLAANTAGELGDLVGSSHHFEQALTAAERAGNPHWVGRLRCFVAQSYFFIGQWTEALRTAEEGYAQLASLGTSLYLAYGSFTLGRIYAGLGRWEEARQRLASVPAIAGGDLQVVRGAECAAAELDLLEGEPERALHRLEPLITAESREVGTPLVLAGLVWAYAALGDAERAMAFAHEALSRARAAGSPARVSDALRAQGAALIELEQWDAAECSLAEALDLARQITYAWREPSLLLLQARLHHRRGEPDRAAARFREGRDLLHRLGGEQAAARAETYAGMTEPARSR